ncbi:lipase family protein [Corynebacterium sp. NML130628]|uniref:lipase family protein n=1 Tax=Corynebacterium sp. NML130628 TaxID=1906333 RepID=UPI0008FB1557|nr:lipase family protein [Corynebacterium sp. NML130628]OIR45650.1 lipase [Corynebacterium sp. NML130628]
MDFGLTPRTVLPLILDLTHSHPTTDAEYGRATWAVGAPPGTLLQATPIRPVGLQNRLNRADAFRIEYVTTDEHDRVMSATGAVFLSKRPWRGNGHRPSIAFAPSTQGVAPACDPSYSCTVGVRLRRKPLDLIAAYEQPAINMLLATGANVVLTDYPRDPEDNVQLYCFHRAAAHALADAVRASTELGCGVEKLGLWGFSQGGGAAASWLERPEYAPELDLRAAVVGAPPADLLAMLDQIDGTLPSIMILYAVAALLASDVEIAEELMPRLSPVGMSAVILDANLCAVGAVIRHAWANTSLWTNSGIPMSALLEDLPKTAAALEANALGTRTPLDIPLRLWGSRNDDIVPWQVVVELGKKWGRPVQMRKLPKLPGRTGINHFTPYFQHLRKDIVWLLDMLESRSE